jgi:ATP-dependent Clp protease ATP-binding subunit ClpX
MQPLAADTSADAETGIGISRVGEGRIAGLQADLAAVRSLTRDDLVRILVEPKNAMTKQYQALLGYDGVELVYEQDALEAVADLAIERKIGARGLRSVMESVMTEIMYTIPSDPTVSKVIITAACVRGEAEPTVIRKS